MLQLNAAESNTEFKVDTDENNGVASNTPHSHLEAVSWAKKYYTLVKNHAETPSCLVPLRSYADLTTIDGSRVRVVHKLKDSLKVASEMAWGKVEALLGEEKERHLVNPNLINSAKIISDSYKIYDTVIEAFAEYESPSRLSVLVGRRLVELRHQYLEIDPLVLGFVAMQFHYLSHNLLGCMSSEERVPFLPYLKAVDDYLSLPIGEIHKLAGRYSTASAPLMAVQHLLRVSTTVAQSVFDRVSAINPSYRSRTNHLTDLIVKLSSIRDIEIYLNYLCLCVLENDIRPVQQELFPLCVMLYPRLHISWKLVQDMLTVIFWELCDQLSNDDLTFFLPHLRTMSEMFSDEVFAEQ